MIKGVYDLEKKFFSIDLPEEKVFLNLKSSLIHKFQINGFDYASSKFEKSLSFRDIEKCLMLFQASFTVNEFLFHNSSEQ
jgi:hypothetical protein